MRCEQLFERNTQNERKCAINEEKYRTDEEKVPKEMGKPHRQALTLIEVEAKQATCSTNTHADEAEILTNSRGEETSAKRNPGDDIEAFLS